MNELEKILENAREKVKSGDWIYFTETDAFFLNMRKMTVTKDIP